MNEDYMEISYDKLFARNLGLYSQEMQEVLKNATVAIGGAGGGPGGITAVTLVRNGIGHVKIADPDIFENHNIVRQYGAMESTLGRNKTEVMAEILKDINPLLEIDSFPEGVNQDNMDDFLRGADVVIDSIDYSAPRDKLKMYQLARENGLYVLTGPIAGLGTLVMCFDPNGVTIEEAFDFPDDESKIEEHNIPVQRLIGCELDYVSPLFFKTREMDPPYFSTNGSSAAVSGAAVSMEAIKILLRKEREKNPAAFPHLKNIPLTVIPEARRIDLWDQSKSGLVNILEF
jgi:molybdopterin/thiamine biosynthesis adenylyltransferase